MIKIIKIASYVSLALLSHCSFAQQPDMNIPKQLDILAPYQASYLLFRNDTELGQGQRKLSKTSDGYQLTSTSNIQWILLSDTRNEHSSFSMEQGILTANDYSYKRTGTGRDRQETISFSPDKIVSHYKNNTKTFKAIQWTFDPLLYQLALRKDLSENKKILSYHVISKGKTKNYTFDRLANEIIKTPIGRVDTIKLQRVRRNSTRQTFIWIAPSLNYSVVKLTQYKDGQEQADLQLNWIHFD